MDDKCLSCIYYEEYAGHKFCVLEWECLEEE